MNTTLLWLMAIPIVGAALVYFFNRNSSLGPWLAPIAFVPGAILIAITFAISYGSATQDTEVWSGQVVSKDRKHGTYEESYDCNCRSVTKRRSDGSTYSDRECDTCYRTHYTVKWTCDTTIGDFTIDSLDRTSRSVYNAPDPQRYTSIQKGDPVSKTNSYTNYVQAVPNSLFAAVDGSTKQHFASILPAYPINVYDLYRIDRFLTPGFSFADAPQWNHDIGLALRELGPTKQVNLIVVIAKTADRQYVAALREHWEGANKNDVVLVIGSLDGQKIEFVDVLSWTKNELFKIQLIDSVRELGIIERTRVMALAQNQIAKNFERRRMREFEYLSGEIDPSSTALTVLIVLLLVGYLGGALVLPRVAAGQSVMPSFRRRF